MPANYDSLINWFENQYDEDVLFSDDVFYPENSDEWMYRFGVESTPTGKRSEAQRKLNWVSGGVGGVADKLYDSFLNNPNTEDYIASRQDFKFYNKLIDNDVLRSETLEIGRELAVQEYTSGDRSSGEKFLSEHFGAVLGGLKRGEQQAAQKAFRQMF